MTSTGTSLTTSNSPGVILIPAVCCSVLTYLFLWGTLVVHANGGLQLAFAVLLVILIVGFQIFCIRRIVRDWNTMTTDQKYTASIAVFAVPLAAAFLITLALAIGLALAVWMFAAGSGSSSSSSYGSGSSARQVKDRYGNRIGSVSTRTGEVKDRYGNRAGSISPQTGEAKDRYGNRIGWIE